MRRKRRRRKRGRGAGSSWTCAAEVLASLALAHGRSAHSSATATHLYTTQTRTQTQRGGGANATSEGLRSSSSSSSSWGTAADGRSVGGPPDRTDLTCGTAAAAATTCKDDEGWLAVWFVAGGVVAGQDPYLHLCRLDVPLGEDAGAAGIGTVVRSSPWKAAASTRIYRRRRRPCCSWPASSAAAAARHTRRSCRRAGPASSTWPLASTSRPSPCSTSTTGRRLLRLADEDDDYDGGSAPPPPSSLSSLSSSEQRPPPPPPPPPPPRLLECLAEGDLAPLITSGRWRRPLRFCAPGRDGKTPVYGVLVFPPPAYYRTEKDDDDDNDEGEEDDDDDDADDVDDEDGGDRRGCPVVEQIYAGRDAFCPKARCFRRCGARGARLRRGHGRRRGLTAAADFLGLLAEPRRRGATRSQAVAPERRRRAASRRRRRRRQRLYRRLLFRRRAGAAWTWQGGRHYRRDEGQSVVRALLDHDDLYRVGVVVVVVVVSEWEWVGAILLLISSLLIFCLVGSGLRLPTTAWTKPGGTRPSWGHRRAFATTTTTRTRKDDDDDDRRRRKGSATSSAAMSFTPRGSASPTAPRRGSPPGQRGGEWEWEWQWEWDRPSSEEEGGGKDEQTDASGGRARQAWIHLQRCSSSARFSENARPRAHRGGGLRSRRRGHCPFVRPSASSS